MRPRETEPARGDGIPRSGGGVALGGRLLSEGDTLAAAGPARRRRGRALPHTSSLAEEPSPVGNSGREGGVRGGGGVLERGCPDSSTILRSTSAVPPQMVCPVS